MPIHQPVLAVPRFKAVRRPRVVRARQRQMQRFVAAFLATQRTGRALEVWAPKRSTFAAAVYNLARRQNVRAVTMSRGQRILVWAEPRP